MANIVTAKDRTVREDRHVYVEKEETSQREGGNVYSIKIKQ